VTGTRVRRRADDAAPTVTALVGQVGLSLRGQVDMLDADGLRAAIAALPADVREIHFDLSALSFIDVGCTRELLALARCPARPRLILHQPPATLIQLIRLLWPDRTPVPARPGHETEDRAIVSIQAA
jgi:STAS domain-containing protein